MLDELSLWKIRYGIFVIVMELRAMDQGRLTTDGIHFDSFEGQAWLNRVFQKRLDEMEVKLFDTGVLKKEETTNEPAISNLCAPSLRNTFGNGPSRDLQAAKL